MVSHAGPARAATSDDAGTGEPPGRTGLAERPEVRAAVAQALERRAEVAQARADLEAERERAVRAGAWADPTLSVGLQNDGFTGLRLGEMETSYVSVVASQSLPWPGKVSLRGKAAQAAVRAAEASLDRARLTVQSGVERAAVELLLLEGRRSLLARTETLWAQSESLARARYEAGEAAQADLLRAQLERSRLRQRRVALDAQLLQRRVLFNRLRGAPADADVALGGPLADAPAPAAVEAAELQGAERHAEESSPELRRAVAALEQAELERSLAERELYPDPLVSLGLMPRGGRFEPMWLASVGVAVPVWAATKQLRAIAEADARRRSAAAEVEALRRLLRQLVQQRALQLGALRDVVALYREGLLVQSEATVISTVAQYQVGRVGFASVLEALGGYVGDVGGLLDTLAQAERIAIAERAVSLDGVDGLGGGSDGSGAETSSPRGMGAGAPGGLRGPAGAAGAGGEVSSGGAAGGMGGM